MVHDTDPPGHRLRGARSLGPGRVRDAGSGSTRTPAPQVRPPLGPRGVGSRRVSGRPPALAHRRPGRGARGPPPERGGRGPRLRPPRPCGSPEPGQPRSHRHRPLGRVGRRHEALPGAGAPGASRRAASSGVAPSSSTDSDRGRTRDRRPAPAGPRAVRHRTRSGGAGRPVLRRRRMGSGRPALQGPRRRRHLAEGAGEKARRSGTARAGPAACSGHVDRSGVPRLHRSPGRRTRDGAHVRGAHRHA